MKKNFIVGIDEVGRGPLAGPVTVAAVAIPKSLINRELLSRIFANKNSRLIREIPLRDSKKLSPKQREIWFKYIKQNKKIFYAIASVSPKIIDKINITQAANLATTRALKKLIINYPGLAKRSGAGKLPIFLDGGLNINKLKIKNLKFKIIVKGDEKIPAIMLASIVAKVTRDKKMKHLHKKYPNYCFNEHKGYGTKKHFRAIKRYGLADIHRKTFT